MRNVTLATMLVATAMLVPIASAVATDPAAMDALISGAKTAADHDALASKYDQQAAAARAKAAEHRSMGQAYKSYSGGKGRWAAAPCRSIARAW
jgi:hypothetical protein